MRHRDIKEDQKGCSQYMPHLGAFWTSWTLLVLVHIPKLLKFTLNAFLPTNFSQQFPKMVALQRPISKLVVGHPHLLGVTLPNRALWFAYIHTEYIRRDIISWILIEIFPSCIPLPNYNHHRLQQQNWLLLIRDRLGGLTKFAKWPFGHLRYRKKTFLQNTLKMPKNAILSIL